MSESNCKHLTMLTILFLSIFLYSALLLNALTINQEHSTDELKKLAPKVFIDCDRCDINYIITEIVFVNYVRNREDADIHILMTDQPTGGGGREYTINFIGKKDYSDLNTTLKYFSNRVETQDEIRQGLVQTLKLGLGPFVARTPLAKSIVLSLRQRVKPTSVDDKWNFWVFNISSRARLNGEQTRTSHSFSGSLSSNRVTPDSKFRASVWANYDKSIFNYRDSRIESSSNSRSADVMYVRSLGEHWSAGAITNVSSSTYSNLNFSWSFYPAVEFNLFPYSQSTRRQLRFLYKIGFNYDNYMVETIFEKMSDKLWDQSLTIGLEITEPWGNAQLAVEGSNYFLDKFLKYYRVVVSGEIGLRLLRGLNLTVNGRYSKVADQLNIAKGDATLEELLLRRKELLSGYRYFFSIGLSYSFGSVFSNVVNPRFGATTRYEDMRF